MLNCPRVEKTKNSQLSLKLIIKQIKPLNKSWQRASVLSNSYDKSAPTPRNSASGSNTSTRCAHKIRVFFQVTKTLPIFTSSEGFNINQKQTLLLDSLGPSWRLVSSEIRAKSFPPPRTTSLRNPLQREKFSYQRQPSHGQLNQMQLMSAPTVNWVTSPVLPAPLLSSLPPQTSAGITVSPEGPFCR